MLSTGIFTLIAAQRLGISDRQCRRLLSRYRESGPLGMANRRRGKPMCRKMTSIRCLTGVNPAVYRNHSLCSTTKSFI
ncbi:helix-turn-helix domain-containing protein [Pseudescherichia vulneris]